ncbi:MAG: glycoside hydrolase family 65 protein [Bilifractor sp.]
MHVTPIYPINPWEIREETFDKANNYRNETTFALSNGYIGTRGTFEEAYPFDIDTGLEGNFVNGFYESEKIRYGEATFGSPVNSQSLLNLPNLKETQLILDGETFRMDEGAVEAYSRVLDLREGVLKRSLRWTSPSGKKVQIHIRRLVSFAMKNIMAIRYEVEPLNFTGSLTFLSRLQADVENHTRKTNPIVDYGPFGRKLDPLRMSAENRRLFYQGITQNSRLQMACGSSHNIITGQAFETDYDTGALESHLAIHVMALPGEKVILEKSICYTTCLDMPAEDMEAFVMKTLDEADQTGFQSLASSQKKYLNKFWDIAGIEIEGEGSEAIQQGLHFNLFHIFQSAGRDGRTGMGAKGLSGEGYEGHYFWDTEMYVMPVFTFLNPEVSRKLLDYRYGTLNQARARARILGHDKGALFPWRTINGEEASTYYPLGTAQYHINADIAYALSLYIQATGDVDYLKQKGAEILIETARVWADVGCFAESKGGRYCICAVTGPDEYNVLVDNNFYTNLMARENLRDAVYAVQYLQENDRKRWQELEKKLDFSDTELDLWNEIIEKMYFPYDEEQQIYPLDDGFMMRKPWDESRIPPEKRSWLYENYHPLFIMRGRMSKQADSILGMYLHSNLFSREEIRRNYDFYQKVTLHHSSLSTCIFGIVASDIGYMDEAYQYFARSARMDLDDYHHNFYAGIHAANMAGTWQAVVNGFAGMRCQNGMLRFHPHIPKQWKSYAFNIQYRGNVLRVHVTQEKTTFTLVRGNAVDFMADDKEIHLTQEGGPYEGKTYTEEV